MVHEWVAGCLAKAFGLPIANFSVVSIPEALIMPELGTELDELGAGLAFGSQRVEPVQEFSISHLHAVPLQVQQDVLVFDRWVRNADRNLTVKGGNPNLLWNQKSSALVVIDHNLAFDSDFDVAQFFRTHVFAAQADAVFMDLDKKAQYIHRMREALASFERACSTIPVDWIDDDLPIYFDPVQIRLMLEQFASDDFWEVVK